MITQPETDADIRATYAVMRQLRPHVAEADYGPTVRRMMDAEGYRLAASHDAAGTVRAVAGYRFMELLYCGRILYVDDLVTDEAARSGGHGRALLDWLKAEARARGCAELHLDSGAHRHRAHRFYFREGMHILGYHFTETL
jgi:GNAT superfamily N-acetyltransferase